MCDLEAGDLVAIGMPADRNLGMRFRLAALCAGATLVSWESDCYGPEGFLSWIRQQGLTHLVPEISSFRGILEGLDGETALPAGKWVILGGAYVRPQDISNLWRSFDRGWKLEYSYGSSETGTLTRSVMGPEHVIPDLVPAGVPVSGKTLRVLSSDGPEEAVDVEAGRAGFIATSGALLPQHVSASVTQDNAGSHPRHGAMEELCVTSDLGFVRDGMLYVTSHAGEDFLMRDRHCNMGEVLRLVASVPGVANSAISRFIESNGDAGYRVFVTPETGAVLDDAVVEGALRAALPCRLLPDQIVVLAASVDDANLLVSGMDGEASALSHEPEMDATERAIKEIWERTFELEQISVTDDLLDLGIGSLPAMVMCQRVSDHFSIEIPYSQLVLSPTIRELAAYVGNAIVEGSADSHHLPRDEPERVDLGR